MSNFSSISYYIPEIILVVMILSVIVIDLIPSLKDLKFTVTFTGLGFIVIALYLSQGVKASIFMDLIVVDPFSHFFKWIFVLATASILLISRYSVEVDKENHVEYISLMLMILLGLFLMASSTNLLMIYLAIELVSIPSYILAGMKKNDRASNEASLKYVIFGSFASGLMLFGLSWLYGISGSTNIVEIHTALLENGNQYLVYMSLMMIMVGFGYKISMAPFHYWTPDVYEGSPTPVTAFFSIGPKAAGFAILIRVLYILFTHEGSLSATTTLYGVNWTLIFAVLAAITMTIGNFLALHQENVKRLLAFSSISHVGFMLIGFAVIGTEALTALLFYLVIYFFMTLSAFFIAIFVKNKLDTDTIDGWKGLAQRNPLIAAFMVISLVSLAGLPPTAGFVGKFYILAVLFRAKTFYWLALVAILNSVVSLYYYFKIIKSMYFLDDGDEVSSEPLEANPYIQWTAIFFSAQTLLFYFYWTPLIEFINRSLSFWNS
jgi:NADH-quinone oxidoreductase subunit N